MLLPGCSFIGDEEPWQQRDIIFSGKPVAMVPEDGSETGIYSVNLDGSGLTAILTSDKETFASPVPSPDGSKLVFQSSIRGTTIGSPLAVVRFDGSPVSFALDLIMWDKFFVGYSPRWVDPDRFVFVSDYGNGYEADVSDGTVRSLDFGDFALVLPGPDSTYALVRERDTPEFSGRDIIFRRGAEPNAVERILVDGGANGLDWSPSGHALAYMDIGASFEYHDLVVVDTLGVEQVRHKLVSSDMADSMGFGGTFNWLPDGRTVLTSRWRRQSSGARYTLVAIDLDDGSIREILDGHVHFRVSVNPLGRLVAAD